MGILDEIADAEDAGKNGKVLVSARNYLDLVDIWISVVEVANAQLDIFESLALLRVKVEEFNDRIRPEVGPGWLGGSLEELDTTLRKPYGLLDEDN